MLITQDTNYCFYKCELNETLRLNNEVDLITIYKNIVE